MTINVKDLEMELAELEEANPEIASSAWLDKLPRQEPEVTEMMRMAIEAAEIFGEDALETFAAAQRAAR